MSDSDPLLRFRPEFPILEKTTYLISNSLGAMPRSASEALAEYADTWATRGVRAWAEGWWEMSVSVGDEIAPPFGAGAGSVTMLPNVTIAVMVEGEFPTVRYLCEALGPRFGAEIVVVPCPAGDGLSADESQIRDAIDGRTALVLLSHVLSRAPS